VLYQLVFDYPLRPGPRQQCQGLNAGRAVGPAAFSEIAAA